MKYQLGTQLSFKSILQGKLFIQIFRSTVIFSLLVCFVSFKSTAQINSISSEPDGSVTILPQGLVSSRSDKGNDTTSTALGNKSLFSNIGNGRSTAIGYRAMYYADNRFLDQRSTYNTALGAEALMGSNVPADNSGQYNTALGDQALYSNTAGNFNVASGFEALNRNTTGNYNSAVGSRALYHNRGNNRSTALGYGAMYYADNRTLGRETYNTAVGFEALKGGDITAFNTGQNNTAIGDESLHKNTSGYGNTASGRSALFNNTTGHSNVAHGRSSLYLNLSGDENTAVGVNALYNNSTAGFNAAFGFNALYYNTIGHSNTAIGRSSLFSNTWGDQNTAVGRSALSQNTTGDNNTAIGYDAEVSTGDLSNAIVIGYNAVVNASNKIRMGNTSITAADIQVAWNITSDRRWKEEIQEVPLGLSFLTELSPVSYHRINNESPKREFGVIAQELEASLEKFGFSEKQLGLLNKDSEGFYTVRYNDLIPVLIKSIQEQQQIIESQASGIEKLLKNQELLTKQVETIIAQLNN